MAKQVIWTKTVLETFIREAELSELEEKIIRTRVKGWSRTRQALTFNLSLSTLDRSIRALKAKYDAVQKEHPELPERKENAKELYK